MCVATSATYLWSVYFLEKPSEVFFVQETAFRFILSAFVTGLNILTQILQFSEHKILCLAETK